MSFRYNADCTCWFRDFSIFFFPFLLSFFTLVFSRSLTFSCSFTDGHDESTDDGRTRRVFRKDVHLRGRDIKSRGERERERRLLEEHKKSRCIRSRLSSMPEVVKFSVMRFGACVLSPFRDYDYPSSGGSHRG